jgi:phenylpropionate dioxygenase-like ring-hydroxylating dioxygenase large terminal subunit
VEDQVSSRPAAPSIAQWRLYSQASLGLKEYWYPVASSASVRRGSKSVVLCGEQIYLVRNGGRVFAVQDRCPHRCVPFSGDGGKGAARCDFAGHLTCRYHGWVFNLESGNLAAALTDGPESPIAGKVMLRTFPVQERWGMIWLWPGSRPAGPLEADVPDEFLLPDSRVYARFGLRQGNWRYAVENGFDEGHAKYLHRDSLWTAFMKLPGWNKTSIEREAGEPWLSRVQTEVHFDSDYPGLGRWPRYGFWKRSGHPSSERARATCSVRLPGLLRVVYPAFRIYEWYVPVEEDRHIYVQVNVRQARGLDRLKWALYYSLLIRGIQHRFLNNQDAWMVKLMPDSHPERFYRPDASITGWRRLVEQEARDYTTVEQAS